MGLHLLGTPQAHLADGRRVSIPPGRPSRLLASLALARGRVLDHDELVSAVWGGTPPQSVRNALHVYVSRLRALMGADAIQTSGNGYFLTLPPDSIDVVRFESLLDDAVKRESPDFAEQAIALYRGPLLAGETLSESLQAVRRELTERYESAREDLLRWRLAAAGPAEWAGLVATARRLVEEEPTRESRHALLVEILVAAGRQNDAFDAYRDARAVLQETLGTEPGDQLRAAHASALRATDSMSGDAHQLLGRAIGRLRELEVALDHVQSRRLITITGEGGVGKSRLARDVLRAAAPAFDGRTAEIDVSELKDQGELAAELSRTLQHDVRLPQLLLLDTCEHLDVAAALPRVFSVYPRLCILATSRRSLGLSGEVIIGLTGLDAGTEDDPESALAQTPGVMLYQVRADEAGHPVDESGVADVARVVRRLGGIPLAIELAATHPDGGRPRLMLERPALELVREPMWDGSGRHRSLMDSLLWTRELISPPARDALTLLATITGPMPDALSTTALSGTAQGVDELVRWNLASRPDDSSASVTITPLVRDFARATATSDEQRIARTRVMAGLADIADQSLSRPLAVPVTPQASLLIRSLHPMALHTLEWDDAEFPVRHRALALLLLVDADLDRAELARVLNAFDRTLASRNLDADTRYDLMRARLGLALASSDIDSVSASEQALRELLPHVDAQRRTAWAVDSVFLALEDGRVELAWQLAGDAWASLSEGQTPTALTVRAARARMHAVRLHQGLADGMTHALQAAALADLAESTESISAWGEAAEILVGAGEPVLGAAYTRKAASTALRWHSPHSLVYVLSLADLALRENRLDDSRAIVVALLRRVWQRGDDRYQRWCLIRLAQIELAAGDPERSAVLLGASSAVGAPASWDVDPEVCELQDRLPSELGGQAYREAFARGSAAPAGWVAAVLNGETTPPRGIDRELLLALGGDGLD